jgi:hypothetical protein
MRVHRTSDLLIVLKSNLEPKGRLLQARDPPPPSPRISHAQEIEIKKRTAKARYIYYTHFTRPLHTHYTKYKKPLFWFWNPAL